LRHKKLLGLALGEKSLLVAEVIAGEKAEVRRVGEFVYPEGLAPQQAVETEGSAQALGKALAEFLKQGDFTVRQAVVGIPARWLLVKPKEVPVSAVSTMESMLRLGAETEFSSELKDLVFDYCDGTETEKTKSVLLVATQRSHVQWAEQLCEAAGLTAVAVTPQALALGRATGEAVKRQILVLMASSGGSELTVQDGPAPTAVRHMRSLEPLAPFVGDLRRTLALLPSTEDPRDIVLWGTAASEAAALGQQLGVRVRGGTLAMLGVEDSTGAANGDGLKQAAVIALALSTMSERGPAVDFLNSRLAPPPERRIPRWAYAAAAAVVLAIGTSIYAYQYMQQRQHTLDQLTSRYNGITNAVHDATIFVGKVSIAKEWHADRPRYLAALRDLTVAVPLDNQTYATNLSIKEITALVNGVKDPDVGKLQCQLDGRTGDQQLPAALTDRLKSNKAFSDVQLGGTSYIPRLRALEFTMYFKYDPDKAAP